ncbi:MAG TPA: hypothetical protein VND64_36330 [Pirellulales bacterium]|nr:hypothetical protein [Pirellulales bacterium]
MRAHLPSLLGLVLGCSQLGCAPRVSPDEAEAIAAIERLGGTVKRDDRRHGGPVVEVGLGGTRVADGDLAYLARFPELETVALFDSAVGDAGLAHLKECAELRTLYLGRTKVSDEGLANLDSLAKLKTLGLSDTQITDAGLARLKGLASLKSVNLHGARTTREGTLQLERDLPGLVVHH